MSSVGATLSPYLTYKPEVWLPLANRTPVGARSHRQRKVKKPCPTEGCHYRVRAASKRQALSQICPGLSTPPPADSSPRELASAPPAPAQCTDGAAQVGAAGIRLLLGVHSGPSSVERRDGIRGTWMQWRRTTPVLACFLLGWRGIAPSLLRRVEAEAARHKDVFWLSFNATEGARPRLTVAKAAAWWQAAAALLSAGVAHVARADDDSFVVLPTLMHELARLGCVRQLCYGPCGWAWAGDGNYYKYECERSGAQPPFPFPFGALQVLSAPVVRHLAASREVERFVAASEEVTAAALGAHAATGGGASGRFDQAEDAALGFWLSRGVLQRELNLTYVDAAARAPNLACYRRRGLYQRPERDVPFVAFHYVKQPAGMRLLWRVLHERHALDPAECHRITSRWGIHI